MIKLKIHKYDDFFKLYEEEKSRPQLIYIIGETHHCYIGSVGVKGGQNGLQQRYQKQYIERAKAIFGMDSPQNQPSFACIFESNVSDHDIELVEEYIQTKFLNKYEQKNALFQNKEEVNDLEIAISGELPDFLL